MVGSPKACKKSETLKDVAKHMAEFNIGSMPVLDEEKHVIGMITDRDVCLSLLKANGKPVSEIKVEDIMTNQVFSVLPEDDIETALRIMRMEQIGRLPVIDKDKNLTGILSLNRIVHETHGSKEEAEIEYQGKENVIKTLHSIALRNDSERLWV